MHDRLNVTFNHYTERQAKAAVESIRTSLSDALKRDLDAVRAEFDARLLALQAPHGAAEQVGVIERLVEDLSAAAAAEMERAASQARAEAEQTARAEAATAHDAAQTQLERERADKEALCETISRMEAQLQSVTAAAEAEVSAIRAELTVVREDARAEHSRLSTSLSLAQQDVAAARNDTQEARDDARERTARLEAAEQRLHALAEAHTQLEQAHAHLEEALAASQAQVAIEAGDRAILTESLEAAHQAAREARAETEECRDELIDTRTEIETLQRQLSSAQAMDATPLVRLRCALKAFTGLTRTRDVLETFLEEFGREFDRVAFFAVRENRLEGWRSAGFEPTTSVRNLIVPLTIESPLTRAASEAKSVMVESGPDGPNNGLLGHETRCAIAIPIVLKARVVAVAYAEMARDLPQEARQVGLQIAEILAEQLMQSFSRPMPAPSTQPEPQSLDRDETVTSAASTPAPEPSPPSYAGPVRTVDRVRVSGTVEVLVDGGTVQLVDISTRGAQIICLRALRPNHQVRMLLPRSGEAIPCQARVVWARLEMTPAGACYRAGLRFTNVDTDAVEMFVNQQFVDEHRNSA